MEEARRIWMLLTPIDEVYNNLTFNFKQQINLSRKDMLCYKYVFSVFKKIILLFTLDCIETCSVECKYHVGYVTIYFVGKRHMFHSF